ncbi:maltose O-acetyltransferase [Liquorilactobacillus sucicola DSM 21376 = JCM 15457]|uniref:Acetyltransferase n=1 Tax=Liquorilactobacillus sucicola DSM 21376 = JCM 15457 TaxID=1423806 RepID=A0A023CVU1_9LACO|nr:sugar O-acetyltransferase [Liquorilactobacillus sucicola]KRN06097.1 maltose O-acetyltransferase [Liquorilactobacillus sucicola DSM 21376 = JCM 15457]GAJ26023.1 maltose O-acetyltransferase [Liquorilactobacillus sucicola DSM 21376 = JCM 15457]
MTSEKKMMIAGKLYSSNDAELVKMRQNSKQRVYTYNQTLPQENTKRTQLLKEMIDCPSEDAYIEIPTRMDYGENIHLGKNFYANYDSIFLDIAPISIGDNVLFGPRVGLYTAGHPLAASVRNEYLEYGHPIKIGNNVWLGGGVTICPGVTIGDNTVIGAGAVVTKDIPANVLAAGVPAHPIRKITATDEKYWQAEKANYLKTRDN